MHGTSAALIARTGGLPGTYAPFAPDLTFPPMNLGLPTVAAIAIRWGGKEIANLRLRFRLGSKNIATRPCLW